MQKQLNFNGSAPQENPEAQRLLKILETSGATQLPSPEQIAQVVRENHEKQFHEPNLDRKKEDPKTKKRNKIAAQSRKRNRR
jgi:hypothetical protein